MANLARFEIVRAGDDYRLRIAGEDGASLEVIATYEQLDLIAESIDEQLDADEEEELGVEE